MSFTPGEKIYKLFYIKQEDSDEPVPISQVMGALYEGRTGRIIQMFDGIDDNPSPEEIDDYIFRFTLTPEITMKCAKVTEELWFDVLVKDFGRIFRGPIGKPKPLSPFSKSTYYNEQ